MTRENQTFIGLRLDPVLLAAVDKKRMLNRQSRSEFVREAIFEFVKDLGVPREFVYPQDRVGRAKGGRPKKIEEMSVSELKAMKSMALSRIEEATCDQEKVLVRLSTPDAQDSVLNIENKDERFGTMEKIKLIQESLKEGKATLEEHRSRDSKRSINSTKRKK